MISAGLSGDGRTVVFSSTWDEAIDPTDPVEEQGSWSYPYIWTRTN
jgi:hypothetical protein